MFFVGWAKGQG